MDAATWVSPLLSLAEGLGSATRWRILLGVFPCNNGLFLSQIYSAEGGYRSVVGREEKGRQNCARVGLEQA